jgi:hypothetical protein
VARIPHVGGTNSTFGNRGPDRIGPYKPNTSGMTAGQEALADAANTTLRVVGNLQAQRQQETEQLARAKATNAILDDELETKSIAQDISQKIADGSLPWSQAQEEFQTRLSQREPQEIDGLDPVAMEHYQGGIKRNRFAISATIDGVVETAKRADFKGQILATRDKLGKFASDPNADLDKIVAQGAALKDFAHAGGLGATFDKDQQEFSDRVFSDNAKARLVAGRDSMEALTQLEQDLTVKGGRYAGRLDADKTNALLSAVQVRKAQLETKAQHAADKGEATAARVLSKFEAQISSTVPAPMEVMTEWTEAMKAGTPEQQAEFRELLKGEVEVRQVLAQPPAQQRAYVQQLQAKQQREGATLAQQANLRRMESAVESSLKQLKEAPLEFFGQRTGQAIEPLDLQSLMSGDTETVKGQIAQRMDMLATIRKQYGDEAGNAPLLPQEASMLAGALAKAPPQAAVKLFGTLSKTFEDPVAYRAAMQQIAPDSPVRAFAGMIFAEQRATTLQPGSLFSGAVKANAGDIAKTLLEGEALLNKSKGDKAEDGKGAPFPMPSPSEMTTEFESVVGTAFAGRDGARETAFQAVRAYYAGSAAKSGDITGELDSKRVREAVRAVLGEPVDVNDSEVFPPWGMDEDEFTDKLESAWSTQAQNLTPGAPVDFDDYALRQAGNGVYLVVAGNGQFLTDRNGKTVRLTVTR